MKLRNLVLALGLLSSAACAADMTGIQAINQATAADLPTKAISSLYSGYPTKCGYYFGVGTGGNAGSVNGAAVGTQIVQGDIDASPSAIPVRWAGTAATGSRMACSTLPTSTAASSTNGLALSGPGIFIERAGVGSPINALLGSLFPASNSVSLPSIPLLPAGITQSPGNGYMFAGVVEQDIGAQIGLLSGHQWVIAPIVGLGLLTRLSNNVMVDTWAGWQMNSNSFCPGGGTSCAKLGNMARVGVPGISRLGGCRHDRMAYPNRRSKPEWPRLKTLRLKRILQFDSSLRIRTIFSNRW